MLASKRTWVSLTAVLGLLVALACGTADEPVTTAPSAAPAATAAAPEAAEPEAAPAVEGGVIKTVAGLDIFIPDGYDLGGPTVPADTRAPRYGGEVTFAAMADLPNLDPTRTTSAYMQQVAGAAYERLVTWNARAGHNPQGNPLEAGLAESWDVSADGLTVTFNLRSGVKWQDVAPVNGRAFTADDVVFSVGYHQRLGSFNASTWAGVTEVKALNANTVEMTLVERDPAFIFKISNIGPGFMVPEEVVTADGDLSSNLVGTGPYIASGAYQPKVGQNYVRNPDYWQQDDAGNVLPYLDGYKHRVIGDGSARLAAFRTGKLDAGAFVLGREAAISLSKTNPETIFQQIPASFGSNGYHFRLDKEPYNDVNVRRAMSLAVDYDSWSLNWWGIPANLTILARGFFLGSVGGVPEDDTTANLGEWYQYDPERAKALLATAGYPNGLDITLEYPARSARDTEWAELMKFYWDAAGFNTTLTPMEYTVYRGTVDAGSWNEITWSFAYPMPLEVDSMVDYGNKNYAGIATQGNLVDDELTSYAVDFHKAYGDDAERLRLLTAFRDRYIDQVYCVCTPWSHLFYAVNPWLRNYQPANYVLGSRLDIRGVTYGWIDDAYRP